MKSTPPFLLLLGLLCGNPTAAATFVVTTTADSGAGSLREAITAANASPPDTHTIIFNINGGGGQTISPATALPTITVDQLMIDGTTQPGFFGVPLIELDGSAAPASTDGLRITADHCTIRGLLINRFAGNGIAIIGGRESQIFACWIGLNTWGNAAQGNGLNGILVMNSFQNAIGEVARTVISGNKQCGIRLEGADTVASRISRCLIGLDPTGGVAIPNGLHGIFLLNARTNQINGGPGEDATVISGNAQNGIRIEGDTANDNLVEGVLIGTDITGTAKRPNGQAGIHVAASHNYIGVSAVSPESRNLISGNGGRGIEVNGPAATLNSIQGNFIGTDITGLLPLGNDSDGLIFSTGASKNLAGGTGPGLGNEIAFNVGAGVYVNSGTNNAVRANRIHANGGLGIDLGANGITPNDATDADSGANQLQNFPVLHSAILRETETLVGGELHSRTNRTYSLDFFANTAADPAGNGEGEQFLGSTEVTTDATGLARFRATLSTSTTQRFITATATDSFGNTSEFSPTFTAQTTLPPQDFVVTTTADSGAGSLRQAILDANAALNFGDRITFNIPGAGPHVIAPVTALPPLTAPVDMDGYTQPGAVESSADEFNAVLKVILDGAVVPTASDALSLEAWDIRIRGLVVTRWKRDGIRMTVASVGSVVEGCLIGLGLDGSLQGQNGFGIQINGGAENRIGGIRLADRNVISGNGTAGVGLIGILGAAIISPSDNRIEGNFIGTDPTGTLDRGNSQDGVRLQSARNNFVGGASGLGNLIAGNDVNGVAISGQAATGNQILGNRLGVTPTGAPLKNNFFGVAIDGGSGNKIGGLAPGSGNTIAFNGVAGVNIFAGNSNAIRGNFIGSNTGLGIDLGNNGRTPNDAGDPDPGANQLQNFPVLTSAFAAVGSTHVAGTLNSRANRSYQLDFYSNSTCDSSGNGEGEEYLGSAGVATDASGNAAFDVTLPAQATGRWIASTATDELGNTSEFSACVRADTAIPPLTFTVTNTEDSGAGSLRQALLDADAVAAISAHTIRFNIPGDGPHQIAPKIGLPTPTNEAVRIDGYTQPGASMNTLPDGDNAVLKIILSGTSGGPAQIYGLRFQLGGNVVRGLSMVNFADTALSFGSDSNVVEGCFLGVTPDNLRGRNGRMGVSLRLEPHVPVKPGSGNRIGGSSPGARNVISGNAFAGVLIAEGGSNNVVAGNFIGTDLSGLAAIPNETGVRTERNSNNRIGGLLPGERNVISGNQTSGILLASGSNTGIFGNLIGLGADGAAALGNGEDGISLASAMDNLVGDGTAAGGNVIAFNARSGIRLYSTVGTPAVRNSFRGNRIFSNGALGIDLGGLGTVNFNDAGDVDVGDNNSQNFPVLTAAIAKLGGTTVSGSLNSAASTAFTVDFFANRACDSSKHGEGQQFLGSTQVSTDASGNANFTVNLPTVAQGLFITATATDPGGNTSEFSECVEADSQLPGETYVVTHTGDVGDGSLRAAIIWATDTIGGDNRIIFNIPGPGPHVIRPATSLGSVFRAVTIDGYSQPGAKANTLAEGNDAVIQIHLDAGVTGTEALRLVGSKIVVRGLAITGFNFGLQINGPRNVVAGCFIGLDPSGAVRRNLMGGVIIFQGVVGGHYDENVIGGETPADRNVISGNEGNGITAQYSTGHLIAGNHIGTDPSGMTAIPNELSGIGLLGISDSVIGGPSETARNLISGNHHYGVVISSGAGNRLENNWIGVTADGAAALGNQGGGVSVFDSSSGQFGSPGAGNVISGNGGTGLSISGAGVSGNVVQGNFIGSDAHGSSPLGNEGPAIELSNGASVSLGGPDSAEWNVIQFNHAGILVNEVVPVFIDGNAFSLANLPDLFPSGPGSSSNVPAPPSVQVSSGPNGSQLLIHGNNVSGPTAKVMVLTLDAAGLLQPSHFEDVSVDAAGVFEVTIPVTWPAGVGTFAALVTGTNGSSEAGLNGAAECRISGITLENGLVVIRWSGPAQLLHAMDLAGPWLPVAQQNGSATISPADNTGFYRLVCP